ncbi:MAG: hypothetical protein R3C11_22040 [Planctomycetaceae bacterium]
MRSYAWYGRTAFARYARIELSDQSTSGKLCHSLVEKSLSIRSRFLGDSGSDHGRTAGFIWNSIS